MKLLKNTVVAGVVAVAAATTATTASAARFAISGAFNVTAVNVTNLFSSEAQATRANFDAALAGTLGASGTNAASVYASDTFTYTGELDFFTDNGSATKIVDWLDSADTGSYSGLDSTFGGLTQSKGNIDNGSATATFYLFEATLDALSDIIVTHDDGFAIFDDGVEISFNRGPTSEDTTPGGNFDGGKFEFLYVAVNNDPSKLKATAVPLPAAAWLLLAASGGLIAAKRRRAAKA
jgi:hypothetical protein